MIETEERDLTTDSGVDFVDGWLRANVPFVSGGMIDFALDVRQIIADLERRLTGDEEFDAAELDTAEQGVDGDGAPVSESG